MSVIEFHSTPKTQEMTFSTDFGIERVKGPKHHLKGADGYMSRISSIHRSSEAWPQGISVLHKSAHKRDVCRKRAVPGTIPTEYFNEETGCWDTV